MAQELLSTFESEIESVSLIPGSGGIFQVTANDEVIWDRKEQNGFPEIKVLKQLVRDKIIPEKDLGHVDRS